MVVYHSLIEHYYHYLLNQTFQDWPVGVLRERSFGASHQTVRIVHDKSFWTSETLQNRGMAARSTSNLAIFAYPRCGICICACWALVSRHALMQVEEFAHWTAGAFSGLNRVALFAWWLTKGTCSIRWFTILACKNVKKKPRHYNLCKLSVSYYKSVLFSFLSSAATNNANLLELHSFNPNAIQLYSQFMSNNCTINLWGMVP